MNRSIKEIAPAIAILAVLIGLTGCFSAYNSFMESVTGQDSMSGNAVSATTDISTEETMDGLREFLQREEIPIESAEGSTLRTGSAEMSNTGPGGRTSRQTMRMRAEVQPSDDGSKVAVVGEYQAGATGQWKKAKIGSASDIRSAQGRALARVHQLMVQGYGGENVEYTDADFEY